MEIQALINRQRVKYIIDSYRLAGDDGEAFSLLLDELAEVYPLARLELALVEVLVESWTVFPMERGLPYLHKAENRLRAWRTEGPSPRLTPAQFEQITGLDSTVTFNGLDATSADIPEIGAAATPDC